MQNSGARDERTLETVGQVGNKIYIEVGQTTHRSAARPARAGRSVAETVAARALAGQERKGWQAVGRTPVACGKKSNSLRKIKIHWFELALIEEIIVSRGEFTKRDLRTRRSKLEEVHAIFNQNTNFDETTLIWLNFDHQSIFVPNLHTKKKRWKSIHSKTINRSNKVKTDLIKS